VQLEELLKDEDMLGEMVANDDAILKIAKVRESVYADVEAAARGNLEFETRARDAKQQIDELKSVGVCVVRFYNVDTKCDVSRVKCDLLLLIHVL
jgi:hypothetical protein